MKPTRKTAKAGSAKAVNRLEDQGKSIPRFFKKTGSLAGPVQTVALELTSTMLDELDTVATEMNVNRQSLIKALIRQALDHHYLATSARLRAKVL